MPGKKRIPWYVSGLNFECMACGRCCSGPAEGYIWVSRPEVKIIADFLKISESELRKRYLKRDGLRTTIIEEPTSKDCIFLQNNQGEKRCRIYPVRPSQCRSWPFWANNLASADSWNRAAERCPGINRGKHYNFEKIEEIKKRKDWWSENE